MTDLVGFLRDRKDFHGDTPSIADIAVYAMLRILRDGPIPHCAEAIEERPTLAAFINRMEGLIKSLDPPSPSWAGMIAAARTGTWPRPRSKA